MQYVYTTTAVLMIGVAIYTTYRLFRAGWWKASVTVEPEPECENCGYDLEQSRKDLRKNCPECGTPIPYETHEESLAIFMWIAICLLVFVGGVVVYVLVLAVNQYL